MKKHYSIILFLGVMFIQTGIQGQYDGTNTRCPAGGCGGNIHTGSTEELKNGLAASPNPFNASTSISFELKQPGKVNLRTYDLSGHLTENGIKDQYFAPGEYHYNWNGSEYPSGIYFVVLLVDNKPVRLPIYLIK